MSVLNLVQSPLHTVLQNLCGRYLIFETEAENLALELRQRQVAFRNVCLNTASLNPELARFGVALREGRVSQAELKIIDLSNCRTALSIETLHLTVYKTAPISQSWAPRVDSRSFSYLPLGAVWERAQPIAQTVWKWFMTNLSVTANEVVIDFEWMPHSSAQFKLREVHYPTAVTSQGSQSEPGPQLTAKTVQFALPDVSQPSGVTTVAVMRDVVWSMGASESQMCQNGIQMGDLELCLTPELLQQVQKVFQKRSGENGMHEGTGFHDAEAVETASSAGSDLTDSVYFDCEEVESGSDTAAMQPSVFAFSCEIRRVRAELRSSLMGDALEQFLMQIEDLSCQGVIHEDMQFEISLGEMEIRDQSPSSRPLGIQSAGVCLPQTLASLLVDGCARSGSYIRLGFPQLHQKPCLKAKVVQRDQGCDLEVQSAPIVFWSSCETLHLCGTLLHAFVSSLHPLRHHRVPRVAAGKIDWILPGVYGVMGQPRSDAQSLPGVFSLELKSGIHSPFLSYDTSRESSHSFMNAVPMELGVTSASVDELRIYHCPCKDAVMTSCHCILSCPSQSTVTHSEDRALRIELTQAAKQRHCGNDLSSLAYQLVHTYAQSDPESLQESNLGRVEYEGKAVQSADLVCSVTFSSAVLDVEIENLGACLDTLLHFWRPLQMADQMKHTAMSQAAILVNGQQLLTRLAGEGMPLEVQMDDLELCLVSGVQRKPVSTLALSMTALSAHCSNRTALLIKGQGSDTGLRFFQVSELDYRNAKFKQWAALQQIMTRVSLEPSMMQLRWIHDTIGQLLSMNRDRLETDVEVETAFSWVSQQVQLSFSAISPGPSAEMPQTLHCTLSRGSCSVETPKRGTAELWELDISLGRDSRALQNVCHEERISVRLLPKNDRMEVEIKNQKCSIQLSPQSVADLLHLVYSLEALMRPEDQTEAMEVDSEGASNILHGITHDAFSAREGTTSADRRSLMEGLTEHEDEDGFIFVEDLRKSPEANPMTTSQTSWLEGSNLQLREDYICLPNSHGIMGDSLANSQSDASFPPASWKVRGVDLTLDGSVSGVDSSEQIQFSVQGIQTGYTVFKPGSHYRDRWTLCVQECEVMDRREGSTGKRLLERDRSQLRTECSKRLKHQQTMSFPMLQLSLETVLPDAETSSKTTEKRLELQVVPLRLRLAQSLQDFSKLYQTALPSPLRSTSGPEVLAERGEMGVSSPHSVDLQKLRNGKTEELVNMVQWEGLEFFMNEIKTSGISGWDHLLSYIIHSWTHDITHSQRHRLLGGVPALGMLKRISPATQNVIQAALSKVTRREAAEQDIRGVPVSEQVTLSRALSEFGRVFSLEVLNLCTTGTENVQLLIDGTDHPQPSTSSTLSEAGQKLRRAAQSVVTDPIQSVRSGEGVGSAMRRAVWATPKALLAPASAAATLVHGTLKRAREALDTDRVFDT